MPRLLSGWGLAVIPYSFCCFSKMVLEQLLLLRPVAEYLQCVNETSLWLTLSAGTDFCLCVVLILSASLFIFGLSLAFPLGFLGIYSFQSTWY